MSQLRSSKTQRKTTSKAATAATATLSSKTVAVSTSPAYTSASKQAGSDSRSSAKDSVGKHSEICAVCEPTIIDGKNQALYCEDRCRSWFHRHCAGVSVAHFSALSSSPDPFSVWLVFKTTAKILCWS